MVSIEQLSAEKATALLPQLVEILRDVVEGGASVGFVLPLTDEELHVFWTKTIAQVAEGSRLLWIAWVEDRIAGTIQLDMSTKANGLHRAEVQKVLVHRRFRRQGIGNQMMQVLETTARRLGRTLLVLDTEESSAARYMYLKQGYQEVGVIPQYAATADGKSLIGSMFMYKLLV